MATLSIAATLTASWYALRAGGPVAILRALRDPTVPRRYKIALALCALPVPGPLDELAAAWLLGRIAARRRP